MIDGIGRVLGWALLAGAAFHAIRWHGLDREMQAFRSPNAPPHAFFFIPLRWRRDLYVGEGPHFVNAVWRAFASMVGFFLLGVLLLAIFS